MSDLSDLVHQATLDTIERVRREERERIIKLLEEMIDNYGNLGWTVEQAAIKIAIELIKGETE